MANRDSERGGERERGPYGARGIPQDRPPYLASYGRDRTYYPAGNWTAERGTDPGMALGYRNYGMEGRPGDWAEVGYGPEGDYGEFGRGRSHYGTADIVGEVNANTAPLARQIQGEHPRPGREFIGSSFVGRGPRNYRRSDARIEEDANEALARDADVDASDIEVQVEDGEVTLSGTVHDRREKRRAEMAIDDVRGVMDVHNRLTIRGAKAGAGAQTSGRTGERATGTSGAAAGHSSGTPSRDVERRIFTAVEQEREEPKMEPRGASGTGGTTGASASAGRVGPGASGRQAQSGRASTAGGTSTSRGTRGGRQESASRNPSAGRTAAKKAPARKGRRG